VLLLRSWVALLLGWASSGYDIFDLQRRSVLLLHLMLGCGRLAP
jgi:hypothetical protein